MFPFYVYYKSYVRNIMHVFSKKSSVDRTVCLTSQDIHIVSLAVMFLTCYVIFVASDGFTEGANILCSWLEKGNVTNKNANRFYTMIHSVNSSVRRLTGWFIRYICLNYSTHWYLCSHVV